MKKNVFISLILLLILNNNLLFAHEEKVIHPKITETAAINPTFDSYLKNNLNFAHGIKTKLPSNGGMFILEWLKKGLRWSGLFGQRTGIYKCKTAPV